MFQKLEITRMAQALSQHAGDRIGLIARNIANADTPGYRALDLVAFSEVYQADTAQAALHQTRPGHLASANSNQTVGELQSTGVAGLNGNSVTLEGEMVKAAEARQENDMALAVYRSSSDIIRACLGRSK